MLIPPLRVRQGGTAASALFKSCNCNSTHINPLVSGQRASAHLALRSTRLDRDSCWLRRSSSLRSSPLAMSADITQSHPMYTVDHLLLKLNARLAHAYGRRHPPNREALMGLGQDGLYRREMLWSASCTDLQHLPTCLLCIGDGQSLMAGLNRTGPPVLLRPRPSPPHPCLVARWNQQYSVQEGFYSEWVRSSFYTRYPPRASTRGKLTCPPSAGGDRKCCSGCS
jgi:hypothetical protein